MKENAGQERARVRASVLLLVLLCAALYLTRLGSITFYEEDEPRFAGAVRTMLQTGDYVTPRFNGALRINKPILYYWLAAASEHAVGVGELGARLPSALLATALVLAIFLFGRARRGLRFGTLAGLITATCLQFAVVLARAATADMTLICFLSLAFLCFYQAYISEPARAGRWVLLSWAALGFAVLAKGPAFLVPAAGTVGLFALLRGEVRPVLRRLVTPLGLLVFAAVAVPWYAAEMALLGKTFYRGFLLAENIGRFQGEVDPHHGPIWFFLPWALVMFFPWVCFLPAGLAGVWRERRGEDSLRLFALCWAVVFFTIFSLSGTKLPHYIAPLYPGAALLVASAWEERLAGYANRGWRGSQWFLGIWGTLFAGAFLALTWVGPTLLRDMADGRPDVGPGPMVLAMLFGGGCAACLVLLARRRERAAFAALSGSLAAGIVCLHLLLAPVVARYWQDPMRILAEDAGRRTGQLAVFAYPSSDVVYYSGKMVARLRREDAGRLAEMAARGPLLVITTRRHVGDVPASLGLAELRREGALVLLGPPTGGGQR